MICAIRVDDVVLGIKFVMLFFGCDDDVVFVYGLYIVNLKLKYHDI